MKTNIELLIQALETPAERGCGICDHLRYSLHDVGVTTHQTNEITRQFKAIAIALMDYPLIARDANYFLFPLDSEGNYQQPTYSKGQLFVNMVRAEDHYAQHEDAPFEGQLGATRLKLIKDVLARLKSKVEIFVDYTNVHLLDELIKQHNLSWGVQRDRTLEDRPVMNNYLIIDLKYKSLTWSENRYYPLVDTQGLLDLLNPKKENKMLKTHTESISEITQLTDICHEYGYRFNRTRLNDTHYISTNLKTLTQDEVVTPLRFVEILTRDAHSATNTSDQGHATQYKEGLKEALLDGINDLERTLRYACPTLKETKNQLEAKLALINLVDQI